MTKLPMKPIYFVPAYLVLAALPHGFPMEETDSMYLAVVGIIGTLVLHLVWIRQAENSLSEMFVDVQIKPPKKFYKYHNSVIVISALLTIGLFFKGTISSDIEEILIKKMIFFGLNILALTWCGFFILMLWSAAQSLCLFEDKAKPKSNRVVGTFVLFFFISIGAPFIYGRLKKIIGGTGR